MRNEKPKKEQGGESFLFSRNDRTAAAAPTIPSRLCLFFSFLVCSPIPKEKNVVPPLQVEEPERWAFRGCGGCGARNRPSSSRDDRSCRRCRGEQWQRQDRRRRRLGHLRAGDGLAPAAVRCFLLLISKRVFEAIYAMEELKNAVEDPSKRPSVLHRRRRRSLT